MKIITISGLDGSGKSTQIESLKNYFESQNKRVFYFHAIEFSLANKINKLKKYCLICKLIGKCKVKPKKENTSITQASPLQIFLRKIFFEIDLIRFKWLFEKLKKQKIDYILSDRYFYDTLINIDYLSKNNNYTPANYSIIKPDLALYLQTDPQLIMSRDRVPDQGLQYLIDKKMIYDKVFDIFEMKVINGNNALATVEEEIRRLL